AGAALPHPAAAARTGTRRGGAGGRRSERGRTRPTVRERVRARPINSQLPTANSQRIPNAQLPSSPADREPARLDVWELGVPWTLDLGSWELPAKRLLRLRLGLVEVKQGAQARFDV